MDENELKRMTIEDLRFLESDLEEWSSMTKRWVAQGSSFNEYNARSLDYSQNPKRLLLHQVKEEIKARV